MGSILCNLPGAPYFFRGLGKTAVNGRMASARPSSSAITKASGSSGLPLLMASAKKFTRREYRLVLSCRKVRQVYAFVIGNYLVVRL